eukprot:CAMPEP_0203748736 /NCGR_PEP_ID=MMETSP0098-20131031/3547_1 /ASSEMBLY_ACC=CAM_ASM_000208 /TAXON_ID=96639 /ORGANISM=" , Strain NY0313808BC1" /LENGTH=419 /DNA_ID=CAMNT_0050637597 /DNA_START=238 /DNA_END=1494 /DNA_ORIENTATION=+
MGQCGSCDKDKQGHENGGVSKPFPYPAATQINGHHHGHGKRNPEDCPEIENDVTTLDTAYESSDEGCPDLVHIHNLVVDVDTEGGMWFPDGEKEAHVPYVYCETLMMLETGAESTFGWKRIDKFGNEYKKKETRHKGKREKRKRLLGSSSRRDSQKRFDEFSLVLCPEVFTWSEPLHYICYHFFPDVTVEAVYKALYDENVRSTWDKSWKDFRVLESISGDCDTIYNCVFNDNRMWRMLGLNYDFVDKRRVVKNMPFPEASRIPSAYALAWKASRQESEFVEEALSLGRLRLVPGDSPGDWASSPKAENPSLFDSEHSFQQVKHLPEADYTVCLAAGNHSAAPKRARVDRCESLNPSGYIIRKWAFHPDGDLINSSLSTNAVTGVRLTIVSRPNIRLPVDGAISSQMVHNESVGNFAKW